MVFSGLVTACRFAICPTSTSPLSSHATTLGVMREPSSLTITLGSRPSMIATTLFVVPRSIPMILPIACASESCSTAERLPVRAPYLHGPVPRQSCHVGLSRPGRGWRSEPTQKLITQGRASTGPERTSTRRRARDAFAAPTVGWYAVQRFSQPRVGKTRGALSFSASRLRLEGPGRGGPSAAASGASILVEVSLPPSPPTSRPSPVPSTGAPSF